MKYRITVAEFIKNLQKIDQNAIVMINNEEIILPINGIKEKSMARFKLGGYRQVRANSEKSFRVCVLS